MSSRCDMCMFSQSNGLNDQYTCHINPPVAGVNQFVAGAMVENKAVWPVVRGGDWCGEFNFKQPKPTLVGDREIMFRVGNAMFSLAEIKNDLRKLDGDGLSNKYRATYAFLYLLIKDYP